MIAIIDYGVGNVGSIQNMLKRVGHLENIITSDAKEINDADKIILPGVGAFDAGMKKINASGLLEVLNKNAVIDKKPIIGICLGMQLITKGSDSVFTKRYYFPSSTQLFFQSLLPDLPGL